MAKKSAGPAFRIRAFFNFALDKFHYFTSSQVIKYTFYFHWSPVNLVDALYESDLMNAAGVGWTMSSVGKMALFRSDPSFVPRTRCITSSKTP